MSTVDRLKVVEDKVQTLEEEVEALKQSPRPGRKAKEMPHAGEAGVCGITGDEDCETCEHSSIYRYQRGCRGTACVAANRDYYREYRRRAKESSEE